MFRKTLQLLGFLLLLCHNSIVAQEDQSLEVLKAQIEKESDGAKQLDMTLMLADKMLANGKAADADHFAELAVEIAKKQKNESKKALALDLRGEVCRHRYDYANALTWFAEAQQIRQNLNDQRGLARSAYLTGQVFFDQKETDKAIEHLKLSLDLYTKESNLSGQAASNKLLGEAYLRKQVFGSAQEHIRLAIDQFVELADHSSAASLAGELGRFAFGVGDSEGALVYLRQSFNLHVGADDKHGIAADFLEMGRVLVATQQYGEGESQLESARQFFTEFADTVGIVKSLLAMNAIPAKSNMSTLTQAMGLLRQSQVKAEVPELYKELSSAFAQKGNTTAAFEALRQFVSTQDQMADLMKKKELLELDSRYQSEIAENTRRRTIERLELERTAAMRVRWALLGLLGFGLVTLWSVWRSYRQKKQDNVLLQEKNAQIEQANSLLNQANAQLDETNSKLVNEIAEREMLESNVFEKDKFLALISREMKQPLQQIIRATSQLAEDGKKQLSIQELNEMQFSASNLLVFVNDMLDYNRIETGKLVLEAKVFDPSAIFNDLRERYAKVFRAQGNTFRMEYDSALPTQLSGDQVRLNQVVSKLLQCLTPAEETGTILLSVSHGKREENRISMHIKIHGLKIDAALLGKDLHLLDESAFLGTDDEQKSRAFSLAMVRRLIELQEGKMQLDEENHTIEVILPFELESTVVVSQKLTKDAIKSVITNKRVLVVEDNKINQLVVSNILKAHGAIVFTADDGLEGVAQMESNDIDLVLMDIQLPKLDGYRATAEIRKMAQKEKSQVAIVALTASAYLTDKDKATLFQMNDHIGKPFSPEELLEKIVQIFNTSHLPHKV